MSTIKTVIKSDTTLSSKKDSLNCSHEKLIHHENSIKTSTSKECSECWKMVCDCKLLIELVWPITVFVILIFFKKQFNYLFNSLATRIKKIKYKDWEMEFSELDKLTSSIEEKLIKSVSFTKEKIKSTIYYDSSTIEVKDLPAEVLKISIEIERILREIYNSVPINRTKPILMVSVLIETLRENGILNIEQTELFRKFWIFRNNIVHAIKYEVTENEFVSFIDIGIRIINILKTIQMNLVENK